VCPWQPAGGTVSGASLYDAGDVLFSTNYQVPASTIPINGVAEPGTSGTALLTITGFFDGSPCMFELSIWAVQVAASAPAAGNQVTFNMIEDGVDTGRRARVWTPAAASDNCSVSQRWPHVPPIVGNALTQHTYDIFAWSVGNNNIFAGPDNNPGASTPMTFTIYRSVQA
jgi:hypothetical protein